MLGKLHPNDYKYMIGGGDPDFNPVRNKRVIDDTIKQYEINRARKMKDFQDTLGERSAAVASFLTSDKGPRYAKYSNRRLVKYFGKRYLAELQGKDIVDRIQSKLNAPKGQKAPRIISPKGEIRGANISDVRTKTRKRSKKA